MLHLQIISDIHLEMSTPPTLPKTADVLILAGDIGIPDPRLQEFLEYVDKTYEMVFYVPGNHEFYTGEYYERKKQINDICSKLKNVVFMDKTSILYKGFRFLGTTLWSFIPQEKLIHVEHSMNDYSQIKIKKEGEKMRKLSVIDTREMFNDELSWLKEELKKNEKCIVITHHAPSMVDTNDPQHYDELDCAFSSDLERMFEQPIVIWICGHTHYNFRKVINGIPLVSNQFGYKYEKTGYDKNYVVHL